MNFEMISSRLYTHKYLRIAAHLLFWLTEMLVSWYMTTISFNVYNNFSQPVLLLLAVIGTVSLMLFYYPLVYIIIPGFKKGRVLAGIAGVLVLLCLYTLINTFTESVFLTPCTVCMQQLQLNHPDYYAFLQAGWTGRFMAKLLSLGIVFGLFFSIAIPLAIKIALQAFRQQIASIKMAKENVELEFNFLKAQINPHFLFNSLNNIYGLILKNDNARAAGTVARLSEFMRYTLYNSAHDKMPLGKEIQLLKDYIELEQIRLNHTLVKLDIQVDNDALDLPSLLLMPVIENAFKYSADKPGTIITMKLSIKDRQLDFMIANTIDEDRLLQPSGGIGLQNFRKRLGLYYPGKHQYEVITSGLSYAAQITIDL